MITFADFWRQWNEAGVPIGRVPSETGDESALPDPKLQDSDDASKDRGDDVNDQTFVQIEGQWPQTSRNGKQVEPFEPWEREEMEKLLREVNGHLGQSDQQHLLPLLIFFSSKVLYPTRFLEAEHDANNFLFNADRWVLVHVSYNLSYV